MATILVVDDHEMTRKTINRRLSKAGHLVLEANTGSKGIEILEDNTVDLILMDFMMKTMNGMQTFERMRELSPQTPCTMLTAYAHSGLIKQFMAEGGHDFMVKPIGEDFESRVEKMIGKSQRSH
ncbi:MAG: PleD family two-component system response regulator [Nitrospinaceae bacterium]